MALWNGSTSPQNFWVGVAALWTFSAAVSAMAAPDAQSGRFYGWLYRFTHLLAANLDKFFGPKTTNGSI